MKNCKNKVELFVQTHNINDYSLLEIAKILNLNEKTVRIHLKALGISKKIVYPKARDNRTKILSLIELGYTQSQIAENLQLSTRQVTCICSDAKIHNYNKIRTPLTTLEEDVVLGSILGDGGFDKHGRMRIKHSCKQEKYIEYKHSCFRENLVSKIIYNNLHFDKRTLKTYCNCRFDTKCDLSFLDWYNRWYVNKKKTLCEEDFEKINLQSLAIWFMDDGSKYNLGILFATMCFSESDIQKMVDILYQKFNLQFKIKKDNCIYLCKQEYLKFKKLILPYIIPSMLYKLQ